jgi:hypothetical protein
LKDVSFLSLSIANETPKLTHLATSCFQSLYGQVLLDAAYRCKVSDFGMSAALSGHDRESEDVENCENPDVNRLRIVYIPTACHIYL